MKSRWLYTTILIVLIIVGITGYLLLSTPKQTSLAFCSYQPHWMRNCNITEIISDLALIKGMGFDGVKIFYEYIVNDSIVEPLLNYTKTIGLKVIFATHATYWGSRYDDADFPNETIVSDYKKQLGAICRNITYYKYDHVLFIAIYYPIPYNIPDNAQINQKLDSSYYKGNLTEIVDYVKSFGIKVSMDTTGDPTGYRVPYIPNTSFYGIMPYSPNWNYMNTSYIKSWKSYFNSTGKEIYMSEYGFRTWRPDTSDQWDFGMVSNETIKASLIRGWVNYCKRNFGIFTYFALFDADGGWGLADKETRTLRESGVAMLESLGN